MSSSSDVLYLYALTPLPDVTVSVDGVGRGVTTRNCADWTAVVDVVSARAWTGEGGARRRSTLPWVAPRACAHEEVVEAVMAQGPVYPARFGTLFSSGAELAATVQAHRDALVTFFDRVRASEEWSIKGYLDREQSVAARTASASGDAATSGTAYLKRRRDAQQAANDVDTWLASYLDTLEADLRLAVQDLAARTPRAAPDHPHEAAVHWVALLPTNDREHFLDHVEALHEKAVTQGVHLEPSGPWPPYTFRPSLNYTASTQ